MVGDEAVTSPYQNIESQFAAALAAHGLTPPAIVVDGVRRQFVATSDKRGKDSSLYVLHGENALARIFGRRIPSSASCFLSDLCGEKLEWSIFRTFASLDNFSVVAKTQIRHDSVVQSKYNVAAHGET